MKKTHRIIFCLILAIQAATGLFSAFRSEPKAPMQVCEECPFGDVREED